jgi:hypothetical protein
LVSSRPTTTTASLSPPATPAQSASDFQSRTPAVIPYASMDVRYSTTTAPPLIVTLRGDPPIGVCQLATPSAIGSLWLIQDQIRGNGFHTPVVARTMMTTTPTSA